DTKPLVVRPALPCPTAPCAAPPLLPCLLARGSPRPAPVAGSPPPGRPRRPAPARPHRAAPLRNAGSPARSRRPLPRRPDAIPRPPRSFGSFCPASRHLKPPACHDVGHPPTPTRRGAARLRHPARPAARRPDRRQSAVAPRWPAAAPRLPLTCSLAASVLGSTPGFGIIGEEEQRCSRSGKDHGFMGGRLEHQAIHGTVDCSGGCATAPSFMDRNFEARNQAAAAKLLSATCPYTYLELSSAAMRSVY
ncbi:hypothetical protein U9M48_005061, partial [Paspalum notatum var. saurae]